MCYQKEKQLIEVFFTLAYVQGVISCLVVTFITTTLAKSIT